MWRGLLRGLLGVLVVQPVEVRGWVGIEQFEEAEDGGDEGGVEGLATKRIKRAKGSLNEDELADLWAQSAGIVMEEMERVEPQTGSGDDEDEEEDEDEDEDDDEEMEGVDEKSGPTKAKGVTLPVMPLEVMHKFMMTGVVVENQFQPPA